VTDEALTRASATIARMTPDEIKNVAFLYFVRAHAALWYLSASTTYFAGGSPDDDIKTKSQ
jgi:hypothetical protein